ncbi:MAG: UDP-N-acetylmuramoyl-tripeptide--D-alanyl-D-alanine ligase [Acetobacteraceae bacterium]|nr:UDP-N-acetylmuramoyl-tripeptide--D-alanyl-D-alanine ligase [Pseudomonadota bacterium]
MTEPLWTSSALVEATGGTLSRPFDADGVSIDTRTLQAGDLFVALVGEGRDGHDFVADALARGAAGAMVHTAGSDGAPVLHVDDTLAGLSRLGAYARMRFGAADPENRLVAVTGSVGKTTTKEMIRAALDMFGPTHAAVASYNNHWGVPLTLARTPLEARYCVAEIGMNHPGEIAPLTRLAQPHVAVITTIAAAHIGNMGSIEAIADEKASIMQGLEPGGTAVLPLDSPLFPRLRTAAGDARIVTFGADTAADVRLLDVEPDADGSHLRVTVLGRDLVLRLNAPGRHMAMNALAALATVVALGLDPVEALPALEAFRPVAGRGVRRSLTVRGEPVLLLDESYNGNGASIRAALEVLRLQPASRRVAVLGDMLELGAEGPREHAALAEAVVASADVLYTCGKLMRHLHKAVPARLRGAHAADSAALAPVVAAAITGGDAVLVKGSLGSRMKKVVEAIDAASAPVGKTA